MSQSNGSKSKGAGFPPAADAAKPASPFKHAAPEGAAKKMSEVLGEIVWLMTQSPIHKTMFIQDLEWFVMTPVLLQQFRIFYAQDRPIGVVFWGHVSEDVEKRLEKGVSKLAPTDWKSGDRLWIVEVISPFGGAEEMVRDCEKQVFGGKSARFVTTRGQM